MKRIVVLALPAILIACGKDGADPFRQAIPKAEAVALHVPAREGQALSGTAQRQDALEGERSGFYALTRAVTLTVNAGTVAVLGLVKGITDHRPTSLQGDVAVWGPHTDPLSPNTYRLTVTRNRDHDYSYVLDAKGKNEPDTAFRAILSGSHLVATDASGEELEGFGNGTFLIDWDQMQSLPEHDDHVGAATFVYTRLSASSNVQIDVAFRQVKDRETGQRVDADYRYVATPSAGGSFDFKIIKNLDAQPALETMTIRSRWEQTGAGRSDVKAKGGDLPGEATASECWDENFDSRFLSLSYAPSQNYGSEAACAFSPAEYSTLSL